MHLEIQSERNGSGGSVVLAGRFDAHESEPVLTSLTALLADGVLTIGLDLSRVDFIDSTGLAVLTRVMKRARESGGDLVLVAPSTPVRVILELTALDKAFVVSEVGPDIAVGH